ncbi:TetR/AcrR family transcriptional regulator [Oceanispirochaeta sp. M1]|uniref:TetR/AcrR family transcriptional regulator n=2 Tax=unclassified Oceanispirochaeta TaxID=2635722 RepID=UPI000E08D636|nr:TetR/AcrR family transcriptional regulator [Oceanispirochaeta sp. M1]RDG29665.1 TetR/AcrR family transcriptional regulator [Oceanispirochaeta sp. M1]
MEKRTTKERILEEAEKQFIELGIAGTQMKDIALAVNLNRRTLYRYFPTKDELAFEIEMIVMKQIDEYLSLKLNDISNETGYEKVVRYFDNVSFDDIKDLLKFTAEFDRYFQDEYPTPQLEKSFVRSLDPQKDQLYQYISEGIADGSIRDDISADDLFHFISQDFFALFQRLILREKHLKNEYCDQVDFQELFKKILLSGIRKN